jgi:hypothetical protein
VPHGREQVQCRVAAVGDRDDAPPRQPARGLEQACLAQSVSFLCRLSRSWAYRSEGASTVRNGSDQTRPPPVAFHRLSPLEPRMGVLLSSGDCNLLA